MSIVIFVVLAVVWVVALTPLVMRKLAERQFTAGVRSYHHRLLRLGSTSTPTITVERPAASVPGSTIGFSAAAQRLRVERHGAAPDGAGTAAGPVVPPQTLAPAATSPATVARRRRVISVLGVAMVFSFVLGIMPAARMMWDVAFLSLGCLVVYVGLLVHFHRVAVERVQKVIALETRRQATAVLESRRHVVALDRARQAVGGGFGGRNYAGAPLLAGSGWSVMRSQPHHSAR